MTAKRPATATDRNARKVARAKPVPHPDPQGTAPAAIAAHDEPKGQPNSDRHRMETVVAKTGKP